MLGTVKASGQVYGIDSVVGSILIWIGFLIYSPLLTIMLYIGSLIGALLGTLHNYCSVIK